MQRIYAALFCFLLVSCGEPSEVSRPQPAGNEIAIRNGTVVHGTEYDGVGRIIPSAGSLRCVGTLISRNAIPTGGQCLFTDEPSQSFEFALDQNRKARVIATRLHPQFVSDLGNSLAFDVAVAVLDKTQTRSWKNLQRSTVRGAVVPVGTTGAAVGFGEIFDGTGEGERRSGILEVDGYLDWYDQFGNLISDAFLTVIPGNDHNQMICRGDTGGPFFVDGQIAGLASFREAYTCDEPGPGYEVALNRFADWIEETVNELDPPGACVTNDNASFATRNGGCEDLSAALVWSSAARKLGQADAAAHCEGLVEGGKDDWRLPTTDEARDLAAHGGKKNLDLPKAIWTSEVVGGDGYIYSFGPGKAVLVPETRKEDCLCVRSAP